VNHGIEAIHKAGTGIAHALRAMSGCSRADRRVFDAQPPKNRAASGNTAGMLLLRSMLFNICFYALMIVLLIFGVPRLVAGRHQVEDHGRLWARLSLALLERICHLKVEFRGLQYLPGGPAIVAAKHQSFLDVLALVLKVRGFTFVYKRELGVIPLFGLYLRRSEQIAVDRAKGGSVLPQVIAAAKQIFAQRRQLVIFPEGTRTAVGAPPRYKTGVARIARETGVVCVPVALNSGLFWRRRGFLRRAGTVVVEFLQPIEPGLDKEAFMRLLETRIEEASQRLVAEARAKDLLTPRSA
jgi:1-acyl-sn-glycerol-3-phosphate acyltransferase